MSYFPLFLDKTAKALREVREGRQIQLIFVYCIAQFVYKTIWLYKYIIPIPVFEPGIISV